MSRRPAAWHEAGQLLGLWWWPPPSDWFTRPTVRLDRPLAQKHVGPGQWGGAGRGVQKQISGGQFDAVFWLGRHARKDHVAHTCKQTNEADAAKDSARTPCSS